MNDKKYNIYINNTKFEVSEEIYKEYYKEKEHSKYLRKEERKVSIVSYEELSNKLSAEDIIADDTVDVENEAINNIMISKLKEALKTLSEQELELINSLVYQEMSEREFSKRTGIPQKTVNNRKNKLFHKLKKILEK